MKTCWEKSGTVGLNVNGNNLHLSFPNGVARADVSLTNRAVVNVSPLPPLDIASGDIQVQGRRVTLTDGSQIGAGTFGEGQGGTLTVTASESVELIGTSTSEDYPSGLFVVAEGSGTAGVLKIETGQLIVRNGAQVSASTRSEGSGGTLTVTASESVQLMGTSAKGKARSGLLVGTVGAGAAGDLKIETGMLTVRDGAVVSARSEGQENAGNITIDVHDTLQANNGEISTSSTQSTGGTINITARDIRLSGNSDIRTDVASGAGGGGNINLTADSIIAFNDSDILASARDGTGGDITLNTPAFLGFRYRPAPRGTDPATLDVNNRVDVNASGAIAAGNITLPDTSFLQNSFTELPVNPIDTNRLIANSCIVRSSQQRGSFIITGAGGLPTRPGDASVSPFPTGTVRSIPSSGSSSETPRSSLSSTNPARPWKLGDPIVEAQGMYRLADGQLVLSRECPN